MKLKLINIMFIFVLLISCGGGGGGGTPDLGTAPIIDGVYCCQVRDGDIWNSCIVKSCDYTTGEIAYISIGAIDPDINMARLIVTQYFKEFGKDDDAYVQYYGPDVEALPISSSDFTVYHITVEVTGPYGEWKIEFIIEDSNGLESEPYYLYATNS